MKSVPNEIIKTLCRHLPLILENVESKALRDNIRLTNAVRVTKHKIIPKLKRIDNEKSI